MRVQAEFSLLQALHQALIKALRVAVPILKARLQPNALRVISNELRAQGAKGVGVACVDNYRKHTELEIPIRTLRSGAQPRAHRDRGGLRRIGREDHIAAILKKR